MSKATNLLARKIFHGPHLSKRKFVIALCKWKRAHWWLSNDGRILNDRAAIPKDFMHPVDGAWLRRQGDPWRMMAAAGQLKQMTPTQGPHEFFGSYFMCAAAITDNAASASTSGVNSLTRPGAPWQSPL